MTADERTTRYLDSVSRMLASLSPQARERAVDGVRARIESAASMVPGGATGGDMEVILARLGSPGQVAEQILDTEPDDPPSGAAVPATAADAPTAVVPAAPAPATAARTDEPVPARAPRQATVRRSLSDIPAMEWPEDEAPRPGLTRVWFPVVVGLMLCVGSFLALFILPLILTGVAALILWSSPLWERRDKMIALLASVLAIAPLLPVNLYLAAVSDGGVINPVPGFAMLVLALLGLAALVRFVYVGIKQARRLDREFGSSTA